MLSLVQKPSKSIFSYRTGGLRTGGLGLEGAGSSCILTGHPSMVFPPGRWLKPGMQRQMAAPEAATSQFVFSPQGDGEQADFSGPPGIIKFKFAEG